MHDDREEYSVIFEERRRAPRALDVETLYQPIRRLNPRSPLCVAPSASLREAVGIMREHHTGCVLVVEAERLVGILTERDLLVKTEMPDLDRPVTDLMTRDPEVLRLDDPIVWALNRMSVGGYRHVPLVDDGGRPVGMASVKDVVHYIVALFPNEVLTLPPDPSRADKWKERDGG